MGSSLARFVTDSRPLPLAPSSVSIPASHASCLRQCGEVLLVRNRDAEAFAVRDTGIPEFKARMHLPWRFVSMRDS